MGKRPFSADFKGFRGSTCSKHRAFTMVLAWFTRFYHGFTRLYHGLSGPSWYIMVLPFYPVFAMVLLLASSSARKKALGRTPSGAL